MQEEKLKLEDLIGPSSSTGQRDDINNVAIKPSDPVGIVPTNITNHDDQD